MSTCQQQCVCSSSCQNQNREHPQIVLQRFDAGEKGFGLRTKTLIPKDSFVIEYVGEVMSKTKYETSNTGRASIYGMELEKGYVINGRNKGNYSRYINHSCDPNCYSEKRIVKQYPCVGIFALRNIEPNEELTINYRARITDENDNSVKCKCKSNNCHGFIGFNAAKLSKRVRMKNLCNYDDEE